MKKTLISCVALACIAGFANAQLADISIVTTKTTTDRVFKEYVAADLDTIKDAVNVLNAGSLSNATVDITVSNAVVGGTLEVAGAVTISEATVDGKYAVTGGDASTGLMLQNGTGTVGVAGSVTSSFAVVFGAVPIVTFSYTSAPATSNVTYMGTVTASNAIFNGSASDTFGYIAVGTRP